MPRTTVTSRWMLNLALAALILGLAVFVYFRPGTEPPAGAPLTSLDAATVTRIEIVREDQTAVLEKTGEVWRLRQPIDARANSFNVDSLLRLARADSSFQTAAEASSLAVYGLEKPALRVRLDQDEISVGAMHPMRQQHYVRYRDTVHLIPSHALSAAFQRYTAFIDTQVFAEGGKLRTLRLPSVRLAKRDGRWQVEPAPTKDISADRLNTFAAAWENARALSVEKLSSRPALAQVELTFDRDGQPESITLSILAYKPEFILARHDEGLEYHFPEDVGKRLLSVRSED